MNRYQRCYSTGEDNLRPHPGHCPEDGDMPMQPADMLLAIAYVLPQPFQNLLLPEEGWREGTIFADLVKPYEGGCRR